MSEDKAVYGDAEALIKFVDFNVSGIECKAYITLGKFGLNMRTCMIKFDVKPDVLIEILPDDNGWRCNFNKGDTWFDVQNESEAESIRELFSAPAITRMGDSQG